MKLVQNFGTGEWMVHKEGLVEHPYRYGAEWMEYEVARFKTRQEALDYIKDNK